MDLQNKLPQFSKLDIEFSKNCRDVYDIFMSNFNKRIELIESCSDDLAEWITNRLKKDKKWKITPNPEMDLIYPKIKDGRFTKFGLNSEWDDLGFFMALDLQKKHNTNSGIKIEVAFGLDEINWYIGQFGGYENKDQYLDFNFYNEVRENIPRSKKYKTRIVFPGIPGIDSENDDKWVGISLNFKDLNRELVVQVQDIIKAKILNPMISKLKENAVSKGK